MTGPALVIIAAIAAFVPTLGRGDTIPAIPLVDQSGAAFDFTRLRGNSVVLSFIYTRCSDSRMCPLVSAKFARLQRRIGDAHVRLLEISLDPAFDTPRVLARYGAHFGQRAARWTLATGASASIDELAQRFDVATRWTQPGTLAHTEALAIIDPQGRLADVVTGNAWDPDDVLALAQRAADPSPAPLVRARMWLGAAIETCGGGRFGVPAWALLLVLAAAIAAATVTLLRSLGLAALLKR